MTVRGSAVVLKASLIVTLPALVLGVGALLYQRTPDSAGGLQYQVVTNRVTGHACLEFPSGQTPPGLRDLAC